MIVIKHLVQVKFIIKHQISTLDTPKELIYRKRNRPNQTEIQREKLRLIK